MKVLRTLTHIVLDPQDMDRSIAFYEAVFGVRARTRILYPVMHLELAEVGDVQLIAGDERALAPYAAARATFVVDSLDDFRSTLVGQGATVVDEPAASPSGVRMRVRHADGAVVEYVQQIEQATACHDQRRAPHAPPPRQAAVEDHDHDSLSEPRPRRPVAVPLDSCDVA